ncbi:hypothetical protein [Kordiimonas gwangyangensis]|uniref:hypothetical protein n=1 Tax=Kordiimonas gwangyangensis TaxID=288022 RepID=UPI0012DCB713|nr:hypothetical protein [Kordiimonas gwangyangensis]
MTFIKPTVVLALMLTLPACSSRTFDISSSQISASVAAETLVTAEKGDLLYSESNGAMIDGAELLAPVKARTVLTHHDVPAGERLVRRVSEGEAFFCTQRKTHIDPFTGPFNFSCLRDVDEDEKFDEIYVFSNDLNNKRTLDPAAPYRPTKVENGGALSVELYYAGLRNNQVIITQKLVNPATSESLDIAEYCVSDFATSPELRIPLFPIDLGLLKDDGMSMIMQVQSATEKQATVKIVRGFPSWSANGNVLKMWGKVRKSKACL